MSGFGVEERRRTVRGIGAGRRSRRRRRGSPSARLRAPSATPTRRSRRSHSGRPAAWRARAGTRHPPPAAGCSAPRRTGTGSLTCACASAVGDSRANGRAPGEQLVRDDGERVPVACGGRGLAERLLGREVTGRAEDRAARRQRRHPRGARDSEVGDVHVVGAVEEQVAGLHVAMDDALRMRVVERATRLLEPPQRVGRLCAPGAQPLLERRAGDVLHDDVRPSARVSDVEDRDDVRVAGHARGRAGLTREPPPRRVVRDVRLGEQLHGDDAVERRVHRAVDAAHRALRERLDVLIALREDLRRRHPAGHTHSPATEIAADEGSVREERAALA